MIHRTDSTSASVRTVAAVVARRAVLAAGYVMLYVVLDWISYIQPVLKLGITPWSPQAGLTVAFLVWAGARWAPATAVAAFLSELLVRDAPASTLLLASASLWIACVYGAVAAILGRQGIREATQALAPAVRLVLSAVCASVAAAIGYVACFLLADSLPWSSAPNAVVRYWIGDANGILMLAPLLLALPAWREALRYLRSGWIQVAAQLGLALLFVWLLFGLDSSDRLRFFYPLFIPVIWIAVRWGASGALAAALGIQIGIVVAMQDAPTGAPLIDLQILMLTLTITGLLLGALVVERAGALSRAAAGEAELRTVLAAAPDAVITTDVNGKVRTSNAAAKQLFGLAGGETDISLKTLLPGLNPGAEPSAGRRTMQAKRRDRGELQVDVAWVRVRPPAQPGWLVLARDATARLRTQQEARERDRLLARAMRFAVAGELASSLTHELNQPITALTTYLRASKIMSGSTGSVDDRLAGTLDKATQEAIRASNVLRRLRDFYHGSALVVRGAVDLQACCNSVVELLEPRLQRRGIRVHTLVPEAMPKVSADSTQVEMVLHNLLGNAIDALHDTSAGAPEIIVRAHRQGERIVLGVHDSGSGVAEEAGKHLFDPFNTTKADGMGLGLAISRNLIRSLGGDILYRRSEYLGGACFEIQLNACPG